MLKVDREGKDSVVVKRECLGDGKKERMECDAGKDGKKGAV